MKLLHYITGMVLESPHYLRKEEIDYFIKETETYVIKPDGNIYIIPKQTVITVTIIPTK